ARLVSQFGFYLGVSAERDKPNYGSLLFGRPGHPRGRAAVVALADLDLGAWHILWVDDVVDHIGVYGEPTA
ncbi:MAG TPA: hypothetical protein VLU73_10235, partial [Methylococcaceae bacterium]|nr:hypothetical protein [Methylococcaceae bacterium]